MSIRRAAPCSPGGGRPRPVRAGRCWKYDAKDPGEDPPRVRVLVRTAVEKATGYAA